MQSLKTGVVMGWDYRYGWFLLGAACALGVLLCSWCAEWASAALRDHAERVKRRRNARRAFLTLRAAVRDSMRAGDDGKPADR